MLCYLFHMLLTFEWLGTPTLEQFLVVNQITWTSEGFRTHWKQRPCIAVCSLHCLCKSLLLYSKVFLSTLRTHPSTSTTQSSIIDEADRPSNLRSCMNYDGAPAAKILDFSFTRIHEISQKSLKRISFNEMDQPAPKLLCGRAPPPQF